MRSAKGQPDDRAYQVERADRAECDRDRLVSAIRIVLREHDDCVCRHTQRILSAALPDAVPTPDPRDPGPIPTEPQWKEPRPPGPPGVPR